MAAPKFEIGNRVRLLVDGKVRRGYIFDVVTGHKRGDRRMYEVLAESNHRSLGTYSSKELTSR
jgi:hypothetical protein